MFVHANSFELVSALPCLSAFCYCNIWNRAGVVVQSIEYLPSMHETLDSVLSTLSTGHSRCISEIPSLRRREFEATLGLPPKNGRQDHSVGKGVCLKFDNLSIVTRTRMIEGENQVLKIFLWCPHAHCDTDTRAHKQKIESKYGGKVVVQAF